MSIRGVIQCVESKENPSAIISAIYIVLRKNWLMRMSGKLIKLPMPRAIDSGVFPSTSCSLRFIPKGIYFLLGG